MTIYRTVWREWTPTSSGAAAISGGSRDGTTPVQLTVYTGTVLTALTVVGTDIGPDCEVAFSAVSGTRYLVQIGTTADVDATYWMSGTGPVPPAPPPPPPATAGKLPWDDVAASVLRAAGPRFYGHYYPAMPLRISNKVPSLDYWNVYLDPNGESGKFTRWGGWVSDRPVKAALVSAPALIDGVDGWRVEGAKIEVAQMIAAGWDGAWVNTMSYGATDQVKVMKALYVGGKYVDPTFPIAPMIDANGIYGTRTQADVAAWIDWCFDQPNAAKLSDGRKLISTFKAEGFSAAWWAQVLALVTAKGHTWAFMPDFLNLGANRDAFASISYGQGDWGDPWWSTNSTVDTGPTSRIGRGNVVQAKNGAGGVPMKYMQNIRNDEARRRDSWFAESRGTNVLERTHAIGRAIGAEWYQIVTAFDATEATQLLPSDKGGWGKADLNKYEIRRTKQGAYPAIMRDGLFVTHRQHPHAAVPTFYTSAPMKLNSNSTGSPAEDIVEVKCFLTAASEVTVAITGQTSVVWNAPAGYSVKRDIPLKPGTLTVTVKRAGAAVHTYTSPLVIVARPYTQDLSYYTFNSRRVHANRAIAGG